MTHDIEQYLAYVAALGHSPRSVHAYRDRLATFRSAALKFQVSSLRRVTVETVRAFHDGMRRRELAASTRLTFLSTVRSFLRWAHEAGKIPEDISVRIELPRPEKRLPPRPLTLDDVNALFDAFPSDSPISFRNRVILELLYACGLRKSELMALDVGDVDFSAATVFVRSGKGNRDRVVPMHQRAVRIVRDFLDSRGQDLPRTTPLFVAGPEWKHPGGRLSVYSLDAIFRYLNKQFHKHVYPHLFRHTFACHLLQGGADVRHVQALLGHESPNTTSRYLGLAKEDLKRDYDRATDIILGRKRPRKRTRRST